MIAAAVPGCGRVAFDTIASDAGDAQSGDGPSDGATATCTSWSAWTTPQRIIELVSNSLDSGPALHPDGRTLVFHSSVAGNTDLYISTRTGSSWSSPQALPINDAFQNDDGAAWDAAGTTLYFTSDRITTGTLLSSAYTGGTFAPPAIVPGFATRVAVGAALSHDGNELYYVDTTMLDIDILRAPKDPFSGQWGLGVAVFGVESTGADGWVTLSADDLEMYFESDRTGNAEIYVATRPARSMPWGNVALAPGLIDATSADGDPELSLDGTLMLFGSDRIAGSALDIYFATRTCLD